MITLIVMVLGESYVGNSMTVSKLGNSGTLGIGVGNIVPKKIKSRKSGSLFWEKLAPMPVVPLWPSFCFTEWVLSVRNEKNQVKILSSSKECQHQNITINSFATSKNGIQSSHWWVQSVIQKWDVAKRLISQVEPLYLLIYKGLNWNCLLYTSPSPRD